MSGYVDIVSQRPSLYGRTQRTYTGMNIDAPSLRALVGADLYTRLEEAGYAGLSDVVGRQSTFREVFGQIMDLRHIHFADLLNTFFDYAIIARIFRQARVAELEQVSGARQKFFVIPMASGNRKLLMYDLTARIVDADSLPINMVVVSSWARTGWNVIAPNVLIDATATRDVTAWQQLRGRAIRARRSWTNDCYRLLTALIGTPKADASPLEQEEMPDDVAEILQRVEQQPGIVLDERLLALLADVATVEVVERVQAEGLSSLTDEERTGVAVALMRRRNKVTHIFELVKAYGSTTQVEYNRSVRVWQRRESIAAKHEYEVSVNPFSGEKLTGAGHAPLVYAQDPRADVPAELQQHLIQAIAGSDDLIVAGWLRYGLSDQAIGEEGQPGG